MHDSDLSDIVFDISTDQDSRQKEPIKAVLKQNLLPLVRESFSNFDQDLMNDHKGDIQVSTDAGKSKEAKYKPAPPAPALASKKQDNGVVGATTSIEQSIELFSHPQNVRFCLIYRFTTL